MNDVLIGTLLGDAWVQKHKNKPNSYSIAWEQSNNDYAIWKAEKIGYKFNHNIRNRFDKRTNRSYSVTSVWISVPKELKKELYDLFYTPKKEVSENILNLLTPLSIAVWYMDDGSVYYNGNNCHLTMALDGFNDNSRKIVIEFFRSKFDLNFKINRKAIRLTSKVDCEKFMKIVEKFIPPCMQYKVLKNAITKHKERKNNLSR